MRQILINHARGRSADKRGGGQQPVLLNDQIVGDAGQDLDVLDLNDAMEQLSAIDRRKHRVVELRFFAGLTVPEIAEVLGLSVTLIESEWRGAKAWLSAALSK